jgi:NADH-quinone oxidoreductase subunit K
MIPIGFPLAVGAILFAIGAFGVLVRRNAIVVFMCIELMLNGVNLTFIGLSDRLRLIDGPVFVLFIMAVAAAEAAVGLAIVLSVYRRKQSVHLGDFDSMKG